MAKTRSEIIEAERKRLSSLGLDDTAVEKAVQTMTGWDDDQFNQTVGSFYSNGSQTSSASSAVKDLQEKLAKSAGMDLEDQFRERAMDTNKDEVISARERGAVDPRNASLATAATRDNDNNLVALESPGAPKQFADTGSGASMARAEMSYADRVRAAADPQQATALGLTPSAAGDTRLAAVNEAEQNLQGSQVRTAMEAERSGADLGQISDLNRQYQDLLNPATPFSPSGFSPEKAMSDMSYFRGYQETAKSNGGLGGPNLGVASFNPDEEGEAEKEAQGLPRLETLTGARGRRAA